ncbi:MAG: type II toxin-antitoxin system RelE/ParE family toxin [Clostridiales bacterium]|jgi:plasmid stabilization system protein ParE|nr:type II toxin-antitoxin system RelE/ParE family toxin [Clostridiales bacterium]
MRYKIDYKLSAQTDLREIRAYLSRFYRNTAHRFFTELNRRLEILTIFPNSSPEYEDDPDYRIMAVRGYSVFYMVREETKTVEIHRIFHGSRDVSRHL